MSKLSKRKNVINEFKNGKKDNESDNNDKKSIVKNRKIEKSLQSLQSNSKLSIKSRIIMLVMSVLTLILTYLSYEKYVQSLVNRPFDGHFKLDPILPLNTWGTFRSGHYFGLKTSAPESIATGIMWFHNKIYQNSLPIRHWCDSNDRLERYQWLKHDFNTFGIQRIVDGNLILETSFLKFSNNSWKSKIKAKPKSTQITQQLPPYSLILYAAKESDSDSIEAVSNDTHFQIRGNAKHIGDFHVSFAVTKNHDNAVFRSNLSAVSQPPLVYLKEIILRNIYMYNIEELYHKDLFVIKGDERKSKSEKPNFIAYQIIFYPPLEVEMYFQSMQTYVSETDESDITDSNPDISYDTELQTRSDKFDNEFEDKFHLSDKNFSDGEITFVKSVLSNMIGSIGYFYGYSEVQSIHNPKPVPYGPLQLLTGVPSRSFFPRGFLWDEGFHGLLISRWDPNLSLMIIKGWLNLMNSEGWIPREVILGVEARARVPSEFVVQHNTNANPPAMFLTIESLLEMNQLNRTVLTEIFPRLHAWFQWFNTSQIGQFPSTYRWRGRDSKTNKELNPKTLTSGLDDYPRSSHPTDDEIHLDLRCWIAFTAKVMARIATRIEHRSKDVYQQTADYLSDNELLENWHWDKKNQMFTDKGLHSPNVKLVKVPNAPQKERKVITPPSYGFVPVLGYNSLFPLMLTLIKPDNSKLGKVFDDLENPNLLWTPFGIRSLSRNNIYYQQYNTENDPPYWRGDIWINVNYLILRSLNHYSKVQGPYQTRANAIYKSLRHNLISNLYKEYERTGYIWEHYNDVTGRGHGVHPFTGWSALIVLIMGEKY